MPNYKKLNELGHSDLLHAIYRHHGGIRKFREVLGEKQKHREHGVWQDLNYTLKQARKVMEEHNFDVLPTQKELGKLGYSSLNNAIGYHGGFYKFRKLLGEEQKRSKQGVWINLEYAIQQAKEVMKEHGFDTLPNRHELKKLGYNSLVYAIDRHYRGIIKFREFLNQLNGIKSEKEQLETLLRTYVENGRK